MEYTADNFGTMTDLNYGDKVIFSLKGKEYVYRVESSKRYLECSGSGNYAIFTGLGIKDQRHDFLEKVLGYKTSGDWPETKNSNDLAKFTRAVFDKVLEAEGVVKEKGVTNKYEIF